MLYPMFLAQNRAVTRVLAKTTKVKNNFINLKKEFKRILSCLFGRRQKVQVTNLPSRTSSLLPVLPQTQSGQCLSSQHFVAVYSFVCLKWGKERCDWVGAKWTKQFQSNPFLHNYDAIVSYSLRLKCSIMQ